MADPSIELSVVIPAYNEETRITLTLQQTLDYLRAGHPASEVIVVDDGSSDDTQRLVRMFETSTPPVRLLVLPVNRGKGAATRLGVLDSKGDYVLVMDADMSTPIEEVDKLLVYGREGMDIVIGSRGLPGSEIRLRQPLFRELMGRTYNVIVRNVLRGLSGFRDTQCGFKLFTREAAHATFSRQTLDRFAFDVEVLLIAQDLGYRIKEVPVVWYHAANSRVSPIVDSSRMLRDVIKLRLKRASSPDDH